MHYYCLGIFLAIIFRSLTSNRRTDIPTFSSEIDILSPWRVPTYMQLELLLVLLQKEMFHSASPPLHLSLFTSHPLLIADISLFLSDRPSPHLCPPLPPASTDNKYHVTRMAMLLHGTLHVY